MRKCGTCEFFHNSCEFSETDSGSNNLVNFVACAQYKEHKPQINDTIYHIDSEENIHELKVIEVTDSKIRVTDENKVDKWLELDKAPWSRFFYNRRAAEIQVRRISMEVK